jgi:hypothetical protein
MRTSLGRHAAILRPQLSDGDQRTAERAIQSFRRHSLHNHGCVFLAAPSLLLRPSHTTVPSFLHSHLRDSASRPLTGYGRRKNIKRTGVVQTNAHACRRSDRMHQTVSARFAALLLLLTIHLFPASASSGALPFNSIASQSQSLTTGRSLLTNCPNSCSSSGLCRAGVCECYSGAFGEDCAIRSTQENPIYGFVVHGGEGQVITQEWRLVFNSSSPYLHLRWCTTEDSWFGGIFNTAPDGMSPMTGSSAETWTFWIAPGSRTIYLADWFSTSQAKPDLDNQQDLHLVNGWRNDTHQCAEFTRPLNTGDGDDIEISPFPDNPLRFMWTHGMSSPSESKVERSRDNQVRSPVIPLHGYLGYTGMWRVDFARGTLDPLLSGVRWPWGYWLVLLLSLACLLLPFGMILQRDSVKVSRVGWCLRKRPLKLCCGGRRSSERAWYHIASLQFLPTLRDCSIQELLACSIYLGINLATIGASLKDYSDVGRSATYIFGHLLALHLAFSLLPVSRNSPFLSLCNIGIDQAITWHRRVNMMTMVWLVAHFVSMIIFWDASVIISVSACQFGYGPLYGTLAMICFLALFGMSVEWVRRNYYKWFLYTHIILSITGYIFSLLHSYNLRWLLLGPGVIFLLDAGVRVVWNPIGKWGKIQAQPGHIVGTAASPSSHSSSSSTRLVRIEVCGKPSSPSVLHSQVLVLTVMQEGRKVMSLPKPGSHVYITVPELSLFSSHPYTISNARVHTDHETHQVFYTMHIAAVRRAAGRKELIRGPSKALSPSWSQQLYNLAAESNGEASVKTYDGWDGDHANAATKPAPFTMWLDGPYHSLHLPVLHYPVLVLIGGGIGITPVMSILSYYMECFAQRTAAALVDGPCALNKEGVPCQPLPRLIHVLWSARDASAFKRWFPVQMEALKAHATRVKIQLFFTATTDVPLELMEQHGADVPRTPQDKNNFIRVEQKEQHEGEGLVNDSPVGPTGKQLPASESNGTNGHAHASLPVDDLTEVELTQPASSDNPIAEHITVRIPPPIDHIASQIVARHSDAGARSPVSHPVQHGRPNFTAFFDSLREDLHTFDAALTLKDVLVFSCGPNGLVDDAELEAERRGCAFTHEAFHY